MDINDNFINSASKIIAGIASSIGIGWAGKKLVYPIVKARSKKIVTEEEGETKANQSLIEQVERLEAEITRLSEKLKKREEKIEEEIDEKNKLLTQLHQLRLEMGNESVLLMKNKDLQNRLNIAEAKILELEDLLTRMAQAKENTNTKIVSSD